MKLNKVKCFVLSIGKMVIDLVVEIEFGKYEYNLDEVYVVCIE